MYPGAYAQQHADRPAFIMASTGETVSYAELEARANRLAHLLGAHGLRPGDHYSIFMENNNRYLEACSAGERTGLHYTPINSHLTADEVAYIVQNSESRALITSRALRDVAIAAVAQCPQVGVAPTTCAPSTTCRRWSPPSTPPRPARCRSKSR